jgi:heat shock protein HtpX
MPRRSVKADWGLRARMFITMGLLAALYIGFLSFLSAYGVSLGPLIAIAVVMLGVQFLFSHRLALRAMRAKDGPNAPQG